MEITDVRMRLVNDRTDRLKAFCTVTFDGEFVIRDIKVVEGTNGFFIAMPSRKLSAPCPECRHKNQVRARYCEECGKKLTLQPVPADPEERMKLYRDIAHPITPAFREKLQNRIIETYRIECEAICAEEEDHESVAVEQTESDNRESSEFGDYDGLIADLKGGAERTSTRNRDGSDASGDGSRERPPRGEDSDSSGDRPRRKRRRRRERPSEDRPGGIEGSEPSSAPPVVVSEPTSPESDTGEEEPAFPIAEPDEPQRGVLAEAEETETVCEAQPCRIDDEKASEDESATKTHSSDDADDDSTPFGAGIL